MIFRVKYFALAKLSISQQLPEESELSRIVRFQRQIKNIVKCKICEYVFSSISQSCEQNRNLCFPSHLSFANQCIRVYFEMIESNHKVPSIFHLYVAQKPFSNKLCWHLAFQYSSHELGQSGKSTGLW